MTYDYTYKPYRCSNCIQSTHYTALAYFNNNALAAYSVCVGLSFLVLLLIPPIDGCCLIQLESLHTIILSLQNYIDCSKCKKFKEMQCCSTAVHIKPSLSSC